MACVCSGKNSSVFTFGMTWLWHHNLCKLCISYSCDEWPRWLHVWTNSVLPEMKDREKTPWFPVHHLPHVHQDVGEHPNQRKYTPPPCDPLFTVARWQAATSCENSLCTCCSNKSQAENSICTLRLGPQGGSAGEAMYKELHNWTVTLANAGLASQWLEIIVSLWPVKVNHCVYVLHVNPDQWIFCSVTKGVIS